MEAKGKLSAFEGEVGKSEGREGKMRGALRGGWGRGRDAPCRYWMESSSVISPLAHMSILQHMATGRRKRERERTTQRRGAIPFCMATGIVSSVPMDCLRCLCFTCIINLEPHWLTGDMSIMYLGFSV